MAAATNNFNDGTISVPVLVFILVIGGFIYSFGFRRAVLRRARADLRATKAAIKPLRQGFWGAVRRVITIGIAVFIAYLVVLVWAAHDVTTSGKTTPANVQPSPTGSTH